LRGHSIEQQDDATTENASEERVTHKSFALKNDEGGDKCDDMQLESDAVSLSPLPKNKIPLGPFIPMAVDDCGRLIREGSSQGQKSQASALNGNSQVRHFKESDKNYFLYIIAVYIDTFKLCRMLR
jgi:hypothetical protein